MMGYSSIARVEETETAPDQGEQTLRALETVINRSEIIVEQMRLHIAKLHPSQRSHDARSLETALEDLNKLISRRERVLLSLAHPLRVVE